MRAGTSRNRTSQVLGFQMDDYRVNQASTIFILILWAFWVRQ